ncbi:6-phosphogluconolactonase [Leifsonia bigeumensis]|uniref:6-phosphogluconolactonase n=1 Tax=Leifsonella bigeumensis TaxID=433643 RepID=A0ABP7FQL4_9MICO
MSPERLVLVYDDRAGLASAVAARFYETIGGILETKPVAHIVFTGGTVGGEILAAIGASGQRDSLDWSRVELWWGDERWLPAGDPERNDTLADDGLLAGLVAQGLLAPARIHRLPASDGPLDLDAAAGSYAAELSRSARKGEPVPDFDLLFLGVGPDGHVASLFPEYDGIRVTEPTVVAVRNSPKPPPERLSLTLPAINRADRVWLCLAGADKAPALGLALAGANTVEVPVAGVSGRVRTIFFLDRDAAAEVPPELLADDGTTA